MTNDRDLLPVLLISCLIAAVLVAVPDVAPAQTAPGSRGTFTETFNGDVGRRAATGSHQSSGQVLWSNPIDGVSAFSGPQFHSGLMFDRDGHLLVPTARDFRRDQLTAIDVEDGDIAWRSSTGLGDGGISPGCTTVADDGTIWSMTQRDFGLPVALVALDPLTGTEMTDRRIAVDAAFAGGCAAGLHLLPGNRAVALASFSSTLQVLDLTSGTVLWSWTADPSESIGDLLLVTNGGERVLVLADDDFDGPDLRLLALDATTGALVSSTDLPGASARTYSMATSFGDVDDGVVLSTAEGFGTSGDAWIVRLDAGLQVDWQVKAFESDPADAFDIAPGQLLPGGEDGRTIVAIDGLADRLVALDLGSGQQRWTLPRPGVSDLLATEALVDADGNVILPWNVARLAGETTRPWDVVGARGQLVGTGPAGVFSQVDAFGPLDEGGTVYGAGVLDGVPVVFAVAAGSPGEGDLSVLPPTVGAGWVTLQLRGVGVGSLSSARISQGVEQRTADVSTAPTGNLAVASFDLRGASGEWQVRVTGPGGERAAGTVTVVPPDLEKAVSTTVTLPDAIRTGITKRIRVTVRNDTNVDLNALPVVLALEDVPLDSVLVPVGLPSPPPAPDDAPSDFSWDDVPVTEVAEGRVLFPVLLPVLGPKATTTIEADLTIPVSSDTFAQVVGIQTGTAEVVVGDCLATNDRQPAPWLAGLSDQAFAGGSSFSSCFVGLLTAGFSGPGSTVAGAVSSAGSGSRPGGAVGCLLAAVGAVGSIAYGVGSSPDVQWRPIAWDLFSTGVTCAAGLVLTGPVGLVVGLVGMAVGFVGSAIMSCGGFRALKLFLWGSAADPNDIVGPSGALQPRYLTAAMPLDYTIRFENQAGAAFPAAEVVITLTLDPDLDPQSFLAGPIGWGDLTLTPPAGATAWDERVQWAGSTVAVSVARSGADVTWRLTTLDPVTGAPPDDASAGFLPPNTSPPQGEGFVSFTVAPADGVMDGTVVQAQADIVFDVNPPITTNRWSNTFDLTPPTGTAAAVADPSPTNEVAFTLGGTDDVSGIAGWRLSLSTDEGELQQVRARHRDERFTTLAARGSLVQLQVQAIDGAGNIDLTPVVARSRVATDALQRIAGPSRIDTAVAISQATFTGAGVVLLARADTYPDALAGAPLALALAAPILLTDSAAVPATVLAEIQRLGAGAVVLLGGEAAIGPAVAAELETRGLTVDRIAGPSRFATAAALADRLASPDRVFVVEGANADPSRGWPDALAVAPLAARIGAPILLATADRLPEETLDALAALGPDRVTVVGGTAAVGTGVAAQIAAAGFDVDRIAGADRYATGIAVVEEARAAGAQAAFTWLATGLNFPDALAAGPAVAVTGGQLLLIHGQEPAGSPAVLERLDSTAAEILLARLVGGPAAIGTEVEAAVRSVLAATPPG